VRSYAAIEALANKVYMAAWAMRPLRRRWNFRGRGASHHGRELCAAREGTGLDSSSPDWSTIRTFLECGVADLSCAAVCRRESDDVLNVTSG